MLLETYQNLSVKLQLSPVVVQSCLSPPLSSSSCFPALTAILGPQKILGREDTLCPELHQLSVRSWTEFIREFQVLGSWAGWNQGLEMQKDPYCCSEQFSAVCVWLVLHADHCP